MNHSYFFCHRMDNHFHAYHRRETEEQTSVFPCVTNGKVNNRDLFSFVGTLIADIEEGFTPVSMNSLRDDLCFLADNIPEPMDAIVIAFKHIDLGFHAAVKLGTGNYIISYGEEALSLTYPESEVGFAMLDHIRDVALGNTKIQGMSEWAMSFAERYDDLRTSERFKREATIEIDLQPLRSVGEIFMELSERSRVPKLFSDHYWWVFSYRDELQAELEKIAK
jgi:hypothetical protein